MKYFKFFIVFILMVLVAVFTAGCWHETKIEIGVPENELESEKETMRVKLYFPDKEWEYLLVEERDVAKTKTPAKAAIEELIKGTKESGRLTAIPDGTKLLGINLEDGTVEVDFSKEFVEKHVGGTAGEIMTVYSVVNTLTEFPEIRDVTFLVEGKKIDTLAGHMDLTAPISRDKSLIEN